MNKFFLLLLLFACKIACSQQWQQQVAYTIDVSLNDTNKTLDAFEKITYINHSPDTLRFIWFHLWPNAYKNDQTAFSDQLLENGNTKFYFSDRKLRGYINRLDFKVDGVSAKTEDHPRYIDIVRLVLPHPLPPNKRITITTPFHVQLPFNFSRGGYDQQSFQVTQWYPKPAVYDADGWHPMPYLDQGEFYSEIGSFNVQITLPENYVVAATGRLLDESETEWLKSRTFENWGRTYIHDYRKRKTPVAQGNKKNPKSTGNRDSIPQTIPPSSGNMKTIRFYQDRVHDFAWFADKRFVVETDTCRLSTGQTIEVAAYYTPHEYPLWKNSLSYTKSATRFYNDAVGAYPYSVVSVVQGPESFGGGMEYPTITIISPMPSGKMLDQVIAHEVGHNWFYGILASNERDHPWMDEGMNTFYEQQYMDTKYGGHSNMDHLLYQTKIKRGTAQAFGISAEKLSVSNYELGAYDATADWMEKIRNMIGKARFDTAMHQYFESWKFKHPQPEDFKNQMADALNQDTALFRFIDTPMPSAYTGFAFISPFRKGSIRNYFKKPVKDILVASPVIGVNSYDGLMPGIFLSNYKIPPNHLQYLVSGMYGIRSKNFTGLGKLDYSIHSDHWIRKTDLFVNGSTFAMDDFLDSAGRRLSMNFSKLAPGIRLTFREKNPRSTVRQYVQWKTFFITEQFLRIVRDTSFAGTDTSLFLHYFLQKENRWLNQMRYVYENTRALYPFDIALQVEQGKDFIRPAITANYFFNYREGGLAVRFFAGKFIYTQGKTLTRQFRNDRYFLNMSGANGFEDYTYSDYFVGRNKFEGFESQQIMNRDGAFKTRSDLLASKIGKTDNWLTAINLNTSIPQHLNPLSVLPFKIPLHLFADIGTYAEAWDRKSETDRFLFDAGFHLPLFDGVLDIYVPVIYSKVFSDYYKSTIPKNRFLKTISFSIHLYSNALKEINHELEFL